jgi:hypothetical protein
MSEIFTRASHRLHNYIVDAGTIEIKVIVDR